MINIPVIRETERHTLSDGSVLEFAGITALERMQYLESNRIDIDAAMASAPDALAIARLDQRYTVRLVAMSLRPGLGDGNSPAALAEVEAALAERVDYGYLRDVLYPIAARLAGLAPRAGDEKKTGVTTQGGSLH